MMTFILARIKRFLKQSNYLKIFIEINRLMLDVVYSSKYLVLILQLFAPYPSGFSGLRLEKQE